MDNSGQASPIELRIAAKASPAAIPRVDTASGINARNFTTSTIVTRSPHRDQKCLAVKFRTDKVNSGSTLILPVQRFDSGGS